MHQTNASGVALNKATTTTGPPRPKSAAEMVFRVLCCFSGAESANAASAASRLKGPLLPPTTPEDRDKKCVLVPGIHVEH
jgi:hypothetical protein